MAGLQSPLGHFLGRWLSDAGARAQLAAVTAASASRTVFGSRGGERPALLQSRTAVFWEEGSAKCRLEPPSLTFSFCESRGGHLGHRQAARTDWGHNGPQHPPRADPRPGRAVHKWQPLGGGERAHPRAVRKRGLLRVCPAPRVLTVHKRAGNRTSLTTLQDRRRGFATTLGQLLQACPADVDQEKTLLVLTMLLAKEVASHTPALLQDVFRTTVNFINQNLLTYVRNLVQNELD
ncbi:BH3-interacting domain death agonist isoform X2 [Camelus dromedarius]|uniref:BH3-interacting domain death agonist isoform X2 n=1 Tax=Camelus dromedarius TaxID=9838 RepID=UPI0031198003